MGGNAIRLAVGHFSRADSIKNHINFDSQMASNKPKTYAPKKLNCQVTNLPTTNLNFSVLYQLVIQ